MKKVIYRAAFAVVTLFLAWFALYPALAYLPPPPSVDVTARVIGLLSPGPGFDVRFGKVCTQDLKDCLPAFIASGAFSAGSGVKFSSQINNLLSAHPETTLVCFDSPGGRMLEASQVAQFIRENRLDTCVGDTYRIEGEPYNPQSRFTAECSSACTFVVLAGKNRIGIGVRYKFGVHATVAQGGWINSVAPVDERKSQVRELFLKSSFVQGDDFEKLLTLAFGATPQQIYFVAPSEQLSFSYISNLRGVAQ